MTTMSVREGDVLRLTRFGSWCDEAEPLWAVARKREFKSGIADLTFLTCTARLLKGLAGYDPSGWILEDGDKFEVVPHDKLPDHVLRELMYHNLTGGWSWFKGD